MGKKEKTPIEIEGKKYLFEDLSNEQQAMVNHLADLDRKINSSQFNLEQLEFGKSAFFSALKESLDAKE